MCFLEHFPSGAGVSWNTKQAEPAVDQGCQSSCLPFLLGVFDVIHGNRCWWWLCFAPRQVPDTSQGSFQPHGDHRVTFIPVEWLIASCDSCYQIRGCEQDKKAVFHCWGCLTRVLQQKFEAFDIQTPKHLAVLTSSSCLSSPPGTEGGNFQGQHVPFYSKMLL